MIAKISDPDQIVGGYNPLQWGRNGSTIDSFIFFFKDKENTKTARINYSGSGCDLLCHGSGTWFSCIVYQQSLK